MMKEIEQIDRLLESNQSGACLTFIESLENDHPDCACLIAAKLSVYRNEGRWEDTLKLSKVFYEKEPNNPVAAAEFALALGVTANTGAALNVLIDAFERSKEGTAHSSLINASLQVGTCLLVQGFVMPVVAIANQIKRFPMGQEQADALLYRASSMANVPLILRDMVFDQVCPDNFPAKVDFEDAIELLRLMRWKQGLAKLESLTGHAAQWSGIWRCVAAVRFWLLKHEDGCKALRTYTGLPGTSIEDAADAESISVLMSPNLLNDPLDVYSFVYTIQEAEKIREIFLSSPRLLSIPIDPKTIPDHEGPPPRGAFMLLNRPMVAPGAEVNLENVPSQMTIFFLFGKETDRAARIEVFEVTTDDRPAMEQFFVDTLGDLFCAEPVGTEWRGSISKTNWLVQPRFRFSPHAQLSPEQLQKLKQDYYTKAFVETWCTLPLGMLNGKTPDAASKDPAYKVWLLGAVQVLEYWIDAEMGIEVTRLLRQRFGLPTLAGIDIPEGTDEEKLTVLDTLPVWRWYRLNVEKLPLAGLVEGLHIVSLMKEPRATYRFATELLSRPMPGITGKQFEIRALAFESLIALSSAKGDLDATLNWIEQAKNESASAKYPNAIWMLHEIPIRISCGHGQIAESLVNDLVRQYGNNEQVMYALQQIFVKLGLIKPDGTPVDPQHRAAHGAATPLDAAPSGGGLWTPDSAAAGPTETGGTSKLWTPD